MPENHVSGATERNNARPTYSRFVGHWRPLFRAIIKNKGPAGSNQQALNFGIMSSSAQEGRVD